MVLLTAEKLRGIHTSFLGDKSIVVVCPLGARSGVLLLACVALTAPGLA